MAQGSFAHGDEASSFAAGLFGGTDLLDYVPDPALVVELDSYRVLHWNRAAEAAYGAPTADTPTCFALSHGRETPCEDPDGPCPLQGLDGGGEPQTVEHLHFDRQGRPGYFRIQASPICDASGTPRWSARGGR